MLALATCYCNDRYREAARMGISIDSLEVEATTEFAGMGIAVHNIEYRASVASASSADTIAALLKETDAVTEVQNTLRASADVLLES